MVVIHLWNFQASKPFIYMPYNISIKFHPIPSTLNFSRFLWQRRPFWNFKAPKSCVHMSDKMSGKFHPIPSTIANQRWISIHNIIIYLETKFRPNRRIFVFGGHFVPWLPWQRPPFWIFQPPQKLPHTTVDIPTKWNIILIPNHEYQFPTSKSTWKQNFAQIEGFLYFGGHFGFKVTAITNQWWISIRNIIIYLETNFAQIGGFL
jgi:hypothetical protein